MAHARATDDESADDGVRAAHHHDDHYVVHGVRPVGVLNLGMAFLTGRRFCPKDFICLFMTEPLKCSCIGPPAQ